jgi:hypothetical protein
MSPREYPGWGAPKIREKLRQQFTGPHLPAISTVHAVLDPSPSGASWTPAAGRAT